MPKISIILAVYNVERYLKQCLDSIINQTLKDIEIICVDDCSTDGSLDILEEYAKKDKRIIIIKHSTNQGSGIARNHALEAVHGEYVGFVDPDDWVDVMMYEKLYNQAQRLNSEIVICEYSRYFEEEGVYKSSIFLRNTDYDYKMKIVKFPTNENLSKDTINSMILISPCFLWNKIYKRELITSFNLHLSNHRCYEDIEFVLGALINAKTISYTDEKLYFYRRWGASVLKSCKNRLDILMEINAYIKDILIQNGLFDQLRHNFQYFVVAATRVMSKQLTRKQKKKYYLDSEKYLDSHALKILKQDLNINFLRKIFCITDEEHGKKKYKVIRLLGLKIKYSKK